MRDSDRIIGMLDAKTAKAEQGERIEKHLLLTRYDPMRAARGEMLKVEDVLEILSIPLLGIIPESEEVLKASNMGAPMTLSSPRARRPGLFRRGASGCAARTSTWSSRPISRGLIESAVRAEGGMKLFDIFPPSAARAGRARTAANLLAHERAVSGHSDLAPCCRKKFSRSSRRHFPIDRERVQVSLERGVTVSTLEIDVELPTVPNGLHAAHG